MIESVPTRGRGSPMLRRLGGHLHGVSGCLHYLESLVVSLGPWSIG